MPPRYDWSRFEVYFYVKAPLRRVFSAWSTCAGLERFFIRRSRFTGRDGRMKSRCQRAQAGDSYEWRWWHDGHRSVGRFLQVAQNRGVTFSFGNNKVKVRLARSAHGVCIRLTQSGIGVSQRDRVHRHLDCRSGWVYFLCSLKAVLEHGVDIRQRNAQTEGCVSVRFKPV